MTSGTGLPDGWGYRIGAICIAVVVCSALAPAVTANPGMSFRGTTVSETTVAVGENVTVTSTVKNAGSSGGGYTFEFERDGVDFAEPRVSVPSQETRTVSRNVSFGEPGTYEVTVNDELAAVVTVQTARARIVAENETRRRIDVRANGTSQSESATVDLPQTSAAFGLERWSTRTGQSAFRQELTVYSNRSVVPETLPSSTDSTLLGVLTVNSTATVEQSTVQFRVERSALANSSLSRDEVVMYQPNGTTWDRLETAVVAERSDAVVYESTATRGSTYVVGTIDPNVDVASTTLRSAVTENGRLLTFEAVLNNTAPVATEHNSTLLVNGEQVNETRVSIPGAGESSVSLSYRVTEPGIYRLVLDESDPVRISLGQSELGTVESGAVTETTTETQEPTVDGSDENASEQALLSSTVFGLEVQYLLGGIGVALLLFLGILLILSGTDVGSSDDIDQF
ncbi:PGF-pre-PGF domain-containing protein [Halomicroarcula sp. F28]|uniref:PGF-pre-PGF domain-containing protein n=1 Tax=Haloarcula salinisoli TaxID=2487746 RepID=UPI001C72CB6A|nr:PGF-pre-PGF domain-containing protein [Halomicroarcula salinisoli]MBX0285229.1 PGF-pre-PGF domain-containing protein [Halomicroarcula salinisoli]